MSRPKDDGIEPKLMQALLGVALAVGFETAAHATDSLNCESSSWALILHIGSNGYVGDVLLADKTQTQFREPLLISDIAKNARHVDINRQAINVRARASNGTTLRITTRDGSARVNFLNTAEKLKCEWVF